MRALACLLLLTGLAVAQDVPRLTLQQALGTAMVHHPRLRRSAEATAAAQAEIQQAVSQQRPHLTVETLARYGPTGAPNFGLVGLVNSQITSNFGSSIVLSDLLDDSGRTRYLTRSREHTAQSARDEEARSRLWVALGVYKAYRDAQFALRLVDLEAQDLVAREVTVKQACANFRAGLVSRVDERLAEAAQAEAEVALVDARRGRDTAFAQLNDAMGIEGSPAYALDEPPPGAVMPDETLAQELAHAYAQRPEMQSIAQQVQAAEDQTRLAQAGRKPFVQALATTGPIDVLPENLDENHWYGAGIAMSWPFDTGGLVEAEVTQATHQQRELLAQNDELTQSIRLEVEKARLALQALIDSQQPVADEVAAAQDGLRLATRRYQVGLGNLLELQQAQFVVVSAEAREARLRYDIVTAFAALKYAMGETP
ncbi:MAG: TolC family protein [Candidatus Xenobia bacterium]